MATGEVSSSMGSNANFEPTGARFFVLWPWLVPALLIVMIWFGDRDHVPIVLVVPATAALAAVGWQVARRVALRVDDEGVSYCNGLRWHRLPAHQISSVRAMTAGGWLAISGRGGRFMTHGPLGHAPPGVRARWHAVRVAHAR